ncbi:MAG: enoyl-CoA hydratase/isomerase family protein [Alphaproteobacteria bacterium]|nr:enoyl-CoA hydratase/isomerase family protein [Alphaproteobacteria bacterium]
MQSKHLLLQIAPRGVATITFDRPDVHNAFDDEMIEDMSGILDDLRENADVRVLIITGRGKSFSAGADLNYMKRAARFSQDENIADAMRLGRMLLSLRTFPMPTVALIQGATYGGGIGVVAACDIAVAVDHALFALTEVKLGLVPAMISPFVIAAIGAQQARRYFQTAERFSAVEALRIGLVHEIVGSDLALQARADEIISQLLLTGPEAAVHAKKLVADVSGFHIGEETLQDLAQRIAGRRASKEGTEGIAAFLERRRPFWAPE